MRVIRITCEELRSQANDVERNAASFADQEDRDAAVEEAARLRQEAAERHCL